MDEPKRKLTEITIETVSVTTIKTRGIKLQQIYCSQCGRHSQPFDATQASSILRSEPGMIEEMYGNGHIHRLGDDGFCGNSLATRIEDLAREPKQLKGTTSGESK